MLGQVIFYGAIITALFSGGRFLRQSRRGVDGERLSELEKRLTDAQDILLSLNEKLERLEGRFESLPGSDSEDGRTPGADAHDKGGPA